MRDYDKCLSECDLALAINPTVSDLVKHLEGTGIPIFAKAEENYFSANYNGMDRGIDYTIFNKLWYDTYEEGDARGAYFAKSPSNYMKDTYRFNSNGKFRPNNSGYKSTQVYHMKAECLARDGKLTEAMDLVHKVREKRFPADKLVKLTASTKAEAIHHIMLEYSKENYGFDRIFHIKRLSLDPDYKITVRRHYVHGDGTLEIIELQPDSEVFTLPFPLDVTLVNKYIKHNTTAI